jgi:hypothetical protein
MKKLGMIFVVIVLCGCGKPKQGPVPLVALETNLQVKAGTVETGDLTKPVPTKKSVVVKEKHTTKNFVPPESSFIVSGNLISNGTITTSTLSSSMSSGWTKTCSSRINLSDGWKSMDSAPRDGTVVELAETYGIAPWFGLHKFVDGRWQSTSDSRMGVYEDNCLYWRPHEGAAKSYVDPTGGKQNSIKYWCDAMHIGYDPKKDVCISH